MERSIIYFDTQSDNARHRLFVKGKVEKVGQDLEEAQARNKWANLQRTGTKKGERVVVSRVFVNPSQVLYVCPLIRTRDGLLARTEGVILER